MPTIILKVNGKEVPLTQFPAEIITQTILGMLKALKGVEEIKDVEISIKN
jgi:molybdopterin-guanine dinucleotide biosynthesis protein B